MIFVISTTFKACVHYNKSGLWWQNFSSQYILISSPKTYKDEAAFWRKASFF